MLSSFYMIDPSHVSNTCDSASSVLLYALFGFPLKTFVGTPIEQLLFTVSEKTLDFTKMNSSIASLTFKGSITEAISEAKKQKKLFVVYISGKKWKNAAFVEEDLRGNEESQLLEKSTWVDAKVVDSVTKYCIFLHFAQGSTDALQFAEIYPQKSAPSITVVGCNGGKLWNYEGYVSAENLASSIEKAWLTLHIQETAARYLSTALASEKSEPPASSSSAVKLEEGSFADCNLLSSSSEKPAEKVSSQSAHSNKSETGNLPTSSSETARQSFPENKDESEVEPGSLLKNKEKSEVEPGSKDHVHGCTDSQEKTSLTDHGSGFASRSIPEIDNDIKKVAESNKDDQMGSSSNNDKMKFAYLNIRLLDGRNLQEKFSVTDTLRSIKDYVDRNQSSGIGSYDLAIPYPRKVFNEEDLSKTLSELALFDRQGLIVVPHQGPTWLRPQTNAETSVGPSDQSNEGYFGYIKRLLSYMNPFAYLGGSSSERPNSMSQPRPNGSLPNQNSAKETPYNPRAAKNSSRPSTDNARNSGRAAPSRFGSNIHTLKHDEDNGPSNDRNTFWNGNNTQYGGNDNDHK
ncbi:hypothetical protein Scep_029214 [Stephania cephalantha]|uniref:UBX domain-containing protein n=1 Tax=Stephania cephalantha TaxID=152367 RepID=A0AAP0E0J5_9MAGN